MITLITGAPGAGKSAALVSMLMELSKGRAIYVNGIPDLKVDHQPLEDLSKWPEVVPDGSIIVGDEIQRWWRPLGPGQKVPSDIAALETHRHRGLDFYIITQGPRLVHANVRALVGRHVHLRDLGFLGRWWYEWPETSQNPESSWKNAPIKKKYRLPKKVFGVYKSASEHIKPIRSFPWMVLLAIGALVAFVAMAILTYYRISARGEPASGLPTSAPASSQSSSSGPVQTGGNASSSVRTYDIADFIPRVSYKPESAPAYDGIRQVKEFPIVAGGVCTRQKCKCVTQQGTDAGLTDAECKAWIRSPNFNPYAERQTGSGEGAAAPPAAPRGASSSGGEKVSS